MNLTGPLRATLTLLPPLLESARHDWWIISSAAVALHGGNPGRVGDVDVLIDPRDVEAVFAGAGLDLAPGGGNGSFRSDWFATWERAPMPVELFAGFCVRDGGVWCPVVPRSREAIRVGEAVLYVPSRAELKAMLLRFGRAKDLDRAARL